MIYGTIAVYPWAYKPSIFECTNYAYGRVFSTRYREVISIYREQPGVENMVGEVVGARGASFVGRAVWCRQGALLCRRR